MTTDSHRIVDRGWARVMPTAKHPELTGAFDDRQGERVADAEGER